MPAESTSNKRSFVIKVDYKKNVKTYSVEHSLNGKDFGTAGTVAAKGNSSKELRYSFTDNTPKVGVNYYRLKMIDNDGTINYSSIQSVNFEEKGDIFKVYPNLIAQNDRFFVETYLAEPFTIDLYTIEGRLVFTQKNNHSTYIQANFPKGTYVYRLNSGQRKSVGKIIIQ